MSEALNKAFKKYAFNPQQKEELRIADDQHLSLEKMLNPRFDWEQMREIRLCLKAGVDPSPFAKPSIPSEEMEHIRESLFAREAVYERIHEDIADKRLKRIFKTGLIVVVATSIAFILLWKKEFISQAIMDLNFTLRSTDEKIGISKIGDLNLMSYVSKHNQKGIITYTPIEKDITKVGTYEIKFTLSNAAKSSNKYMRLRIIDDVKPTLILKTSSIVLHEGERFEAKNYIAEASDNVDAGSLIDRVSINDKVDTSKSGKYVVNYFLSDASGNSASQSLSVEIKKKQLEKKSSERKNVLKKKTVSDNNKAKTLEEKKISKKKNTLSKKKSSSGGKKASKKRVSLKKATASSKMFSFSSSSNMSATYQKALAYAKAQMSAGRASSYNVVPVRASDGTYIGYRVTFK